MSGELLPFAEPYAEEPTCRLCGSAENTLDEDEVCLDAVCQAIWARETALADAA